jgi:25S rRNA (uracil2843-N3)-methyltransferase
VFRALCYFDMFLNSPTINRLLQSSCSIYSIGAGSGGELLGFSGALSFLRKSGCGSPGNVSTTLHIQDIADYTFALKRLEDAMWQHLSHATFTSCASLQVSSAMPQDILSAVRSDDFSSSAERAIIESIQSADMITAMFLLNELLSTSKREFVALIKLIIQSMRPGALLLVVDSAGSFSEVEVGSGPSDSSESNKRVYMVYTLLDSISALEVLEQANSKWFRFPKTLKFQIPLNNIRYFLRLYRKK